jgi:hypothetical protein
MRTTLSRIALIALLITVPLPPAVADTPAAGLTVTSSKLTIDGTSTMHDYSLATSMLIVKSAVVDGPSLLQPGMLQDFELQIPLTSFVSDKNGLTKKMLETMTADKYPFITFALTDYSVEGAAVRATGTLTVAGVAKPVDIELNVKETPAGLHVTGTRALSMKDFGIKPPTMFMGMLKTNEQVTIKFELQLTRAATATN